MTKQELDKKMLELQKGSEQAFEEIYSETSKGLFAFLLSYCKDYQLAEDMMQNSYIKLRTTIAQYKAGSNAFAWLYTIAKNTTINELNRRNREMPIDMETGSDVFGSYTFEYEDTPVMKLMAKILTDSERQIVTLHVVSGFKHREIADMLDKPLGTVLWTYNNALAKLKKTIEKDRESYE